MVGSLEQLGAAGDSGVTKVLNILQRASLRWRWSWRVGRPLPALALSEAYSEHSRNNSVQQCIVGNRMLPRNSLDLELPLLLQCSYNHVSEKQ